MGFRFRKSVNSGPFRINFSKTGIGGSVGVPGMRFTKTATGRNRTTLSVPGTGISYVKESGGKNSKRRGKAKQGHSTFFKLSAGVGTVLTMLVDIRNSRVCRATWVYRI